MPAISFPATTKGGYFNIVGAASAAKKVGNILRG